jgi:hypothetical protein
MKFVVQPETHSHLVRGGRGYWLTERLWTEAANLPVRTVEIDTIPEFDMDCWFEGKAATCRAVAEHARRIEAANLAYPVILSASGGLMDGGHRIAKAYLLGERTVSARRFLIDPEPDWIVPDPGSGSVDRPGTYPERVTELPIELLSPVDVDNLEAEKVSRYAAILAELPPVTVFSLPEGYLLVDGYHRVAAARLLGRTVVMADVRRGTRTDALRFAVEHAAEERGLPAADALAAIQLHSGSH